MQRKQPINSYLKSLLLKYGVYINARREEKENRNHPVMQIKFLVF